MLTNGLHAKPLKKKPHCRLSGLETLIDYNICTHKCSFPTFKACLLSSKSTTTQPRVIKRTTIFTMLPQACVFSFWSNNQTVQRLWEKLSGTPPCSLDVQGATATIIKALSKVASSAPLCPSLDSN